jgi:hypothetical protein
MSWCISPVLILFRMSLIDRGVLRLRWLRHDAQFFESAMYLVCMFGLRSIDRDCARVSLR